MDNKFNRIDLIDFYYLTLTAKKFNIDINPFYSGDILVTLSKPNSFTEDFRTVKLAKAFLDGYQIGLNSKNNS